ncbi:MAG: hypothetical protein ABSE36_16905 [Terracidiphilus sp.]|jgi:hypothetical protein
MFNLAFLLQQGPSADDIQHMIVAMMAILPLIILVCLAIIIVPFWFICKKAGFSPWLSLLNIVPMGNLILIYSAGLCAVEGGAGATDGVSAAVSATAAATAAVRR